MRVSDESLRRFMRLYTEFYSEELTVNEAHAMASRVAFLYEHLAKPLPNDHHLMPPRQTGDPPSSPPNGRCSEGSPGTQDRLLEL